MKQTISIATKEGSFSGEADVIGGLALHTEYDHVSKTFGDPKYYWWQITHIGTGYKVPGHYIEKATATKVRRELLKIGDWTVFTDPNGFPADFKQKARDVLERFKNKAF